VILYQIIFGWVEDPPGSGSGTFGSPIGLLLALTYGTSGDYLLDAETPADAMLDADGDYIVPA